MRLAQRHFPISLVDGSVTRLDDGSVAVMVRLAGAVDTSARAGHYFYEVIRAVACLDLLHDHTCVLQSVYDCHLQVDYARNRNGSLTDTVQSTYFLEVNLGKGLSGQNLGGGTESSLHNTSCCTEDHGSAGRLSER